MQRWYKVAVVSLVAGTIIRVVWGLWVHPPFDFIYSDMLGYVERGRRFAAGGPFGPGDAFYPPTTHLLLAGAFKLFGSSRHGLWAGAVLWCLMSCSIPFLAWRIAARWLSPTAAAITAGLCAFYPPFITYGGYFLSEIPSIAFMLAALLLALRATEVSGTRRLLRTLLFAGVGAVAIAARPQVVVNLAIAAWALLGVSQKWRGRLAVAAAGGVGLLIPLVPIIALNAHATGHFAGLSENAGSVFFQAQCPVRGSYYGDPTHGYFYTFGITTAIQQGRGHDFVFPDHFPWEQGYFYEQGLWCIRREGFSHIKAVARNISDMGLTSVPWPMSADPGLHRYVKPANIVYSVLLPTVVVAGLFEMRRKRRAGERGPEGLLLAHLAAMIPLALLFIGDPRYRLPYDFFGFALAASLLVTLASMRFRGAGSSEEEPVETHLEK